MSNHFKIIIPFYNVEQWIKICIRSVKAQDYNDYECILIDDISTDNSADIVKKEIGDDKRFRLVSNKNKAYALKNIYDAIELSNPDQEDIIVTLDGDDWLASSSVLSYLSDFYSKERCWLTYGSYAEYPSGMKGKFARQIPKHIIDSSSYRNAQWMTSHLRTFKYHLWKEIDVKDMKDKAGNFYQMAWDLSFMLPMLEMSANKHRYIDEILYIYNRTNPLNDDKVDHRKQLGFEQEIRNKSKYDRVAIDARSLLTPNRYDIAAKTIYAKALVKGTEDGFAKDLYLKHLKVWNNFYEKTPRKEGQESFINSFQDTLRSIRDNGFKKEGSIPLFRESPLNGAHRIASCIALDAPIQVRNGTPSEGQYACNYEYFRDKKDFAPEGLDQIYLDEMALEYCRSKNNLFTVTLFPSHNCPVERLVSHIKQKYDIIYSKNVTLNDIGKRNYIHNLYHNEGWIGSKEHNYPGVLEKSRLCFSEGGEIKVLLIEEDECQKLLTLKKELRSICDVGKHSVHINDTQEETWRVASSVFNKNSIHFLNNRIMNDTPRFDGFLSQYVAIIGQRKDYHDFCADSSTVLSAYGLRDCRDLDFLHLRDINNLGLMIECHNAESHHYRVPKNEIIYNPQNHFYFLGVKFASLAVVDGMKEYRGEEKDKKDRLLCRKPLTNTMENCK